MNKQLDYHIDRRDGVMLIQPGGLLDSSQIARFEEVVMGQVQTGRHDVILDFEQLTFLSSSALRILLGAGRDAKKRNNAFLLCALKPHISDLMKTAGFDRLLTLHDTREHAMQNAAQARGANTATTEPATTAPAEPSTNAGEVRQEPATAPARESTDISKRGLFQPTWTRLWWHLCFDASIAAAGVAGAWLFYNHPLAWENFTVAFLLLAVPTTLVSFGPPPFRRFFNRLVD